jgi:hypothetical protein
MFQGCRWIGYIVALRVSSACLHPQNRPRDRRMCDVFGRLRNNLRAFAEMARKYL